MIKDHDGCLNVNYNSCIQDLPETRTLVAAQVVEGYVSLCLARLVAG